MKSLSEIRNDLSALRRPGSEHLSVDYKTADSESVRKAFNTVFARQQYLVEILDQVIECIELYERADELEEKACVNDPANREW